MAPLTLRIVAGAIACAAVLPAFILALGTFVPGIPLVSPAGTSAFPAFAGPWLFIALAGCVLGVATAHLGARRTGRILAVLGLLTAIGAGLVIARHMRIAEDNGASVNLPATMMLRGADEGATPDETTVYTRVGGRDLHLDIYRPTSRPGELAPVAVYVHGGGWIAGDRTARAANMRWLAERGYLGISLDYVLATAEQATWDAAAPQVACGLSWVAATAVKYGGDPARLFVLGESAGGALALSTTYAAAAGVATSSCGGHIPVVRAVAARVPALDPVTFYGNPDPIAGPSARQMVSWYLGGTPRDHPDRARAVSAVTYVTPNAPPTLLVLSDNDHLVPIAGALEFIERTQQAGVALQIVRFPWADHGVARQYYSVVNQAWLGIMRTHFCRHGGLCS